MRALLITVAAGGAGLQWVDVPRPALGPGEIRVRVVASSVNRADLLIRAGTHRSADRSRPAIAGLDAAGEVVEVGSGVRTVHVGDRVMAMVDGGLAEEVVVAADMAVPIPQAWTYVEGAAAVLGLMTEHDALATNGHLQSGETVLIHAVASGVGTQSIQLARELGAGTIIGTTRSPRPMQPFAALGLDHLVVTKDAAFADRVLELTGGSGADLIVDHVGGPYLAENIRAAAVSARVVGVGRLGGATGTLDMEELARKRLRLVGTTFRTRTPAEKVQVVTDLRDGVDLEAVADRLRPVVHHVLPWTEALGAQDSLEDGEHLGKIVLLVDQH